METWAIFVRENEDGTGTGDHAEDTPMFKSEAGAEEAAVAYRKRFFDEEDWPNVYVSETCRKHFGRVLDAAECPCNEEMPYEDDRGFLNGNGKHV